MKDELDNNKVLEDFYFAYEAKRNLLKEQKEDYAFRLGKQWPREALDKLKNKGVLVVTDNRCEANIHLLTGTERQNRTDIRAFPEGEVQG